jgi:hypothetical protein
VVYGLRLWSHGILKKSQRDWISFVLFLFKVLARTYFSITGLSKEKWGGREEKHLLLPTQEMGVRLLYSFCISFSNYVKINH